MEDIDYSGLLAQELTKGRSGFNPIIRERTPLMENQMQKKH